MTERERKLLAKDIAAELAEVHAGKCLLGLDVESVHDLKDLAATWRKGKKVTLVTTLTILVASMVGVFFLGIAVKIKEVVHGG